MYKGKKILSLITARGGSKGIPGKNIKDLGGKPLIAWTIQSSLDSKLIDRTVLSSDSDEIIKIAKRFGCEVPFKRPDNLAQDETSSIEVICHALSKIEGYDYLVLLQPTSPFRSNGILDEMIMKIIDDDIKQLVSVKQLKKESHFIYERDKDNYLVPLSGEYVLNKRRQDQSPLYEHNGSVYISEIEFLLKNKSYNCKETQMFEMKGKDNLDIDEHIDFQLAKIIIKDNEH